MSDPARWLELERLYHAALERPLDERASFVEQACAGDEWLRSELESLLEQDRPGDDFLDRPAMEVAARELAVNEIEPASIEAGSQIGSYKILAQIARGGMGVVYRAEQQHPVRRIVALKVIKPGMDSEQVIARFQAERQALALMDHPSVSRRSVWAAEDVVRLGDNSPYQSLPEQFTCSLSELTANSYR